MTATSYERADTRTWFGLCVLVLTGVLVSMDMSVLLFALPFVSADLQPSSAEMLWILDIYGFLLAGLLIVMGTLGDRIGRRKLLLFGAGLFGCASLLAAFSTSSEMLIVARALLGIGGSTLAPSTLSLIRNMFHDAQQRSVAIGVWTAGFAGGSALGPIVGGALLEYFWWGSVFLLNVPVMVLLLVLAPLVVPEFKDPSPGRFDLISAVLSLAAVLPVIYGVKRFAESGFSVTIGLTIAVGVVFGVLFILRQRAPQPLIDIQLFRERAFSASVMSNMLTTFAMMGVLLFVAQFLQLVIGMRPIIAAVWMLPAFLGMPVGIAAATWLTRRFRPGAVVSAGLGTAAVGMGLLHWLDVGPRLPLIITASFIMAFGIGSVSTLANSLVIATAPPERAGAASAISETGTEFGGALGMAILGSVGWAVYGSHLVDSAPAAVPTEVVGTARESLGAAAEVSAGLPADVGDSLVAAAHESFVYGLSVTGVVGAVIMAVASVAAAVLLREVQSTEAAESVHSNE